MCDTLWINQGNTIFGKNSDRKPNEPNLLVYVPSKEYPDGTKVKCTYIEVPQSVKTHAVLLYKPSWMFGAEMGINQFGVSIGNEAVFTKSKGKKTERLTGMDMLRLALERAETAREATDIIIQLLTSFGQGGNCGFQANFYYDNSFLIADKHECFVLETCGKDYLVQKPTRQANISNRLNIGAEYHESNLKEKIDFAKKNREPIYSFFSGSENRRSFIETKLQGITEANISDIFRVLRGHAKENAKLFTKGSVKSVCMHAGGIGDHTTGSMAIEYRKNKPSTIWLTGSSTPCLSVFKPYFFGITAPPVFEDEKNSLQFWLMREYFVRAVYGGLIDAKEFQEKAQSLENEFIQKERDIFALDNITNYQLEKFAHDCATSEQKLYDEYKAEIDAVKNGQAKLPAYWQKQTKTLGHNAFENIVKP